MRTVEASRFVQEPPDSVRRALSPTALVEYEGTFTVEGTASEADGTVVTASAPGLTVEFVVRETEEGRWAYEQRGDAGPFDYMRTEVSIEPENEGSTVTLTSTVSLGLPPAFLTDRIAAWKRKNELERALEALADDVE